MTNRGIPFVLILVMVFLGSVIWNWNRLSTKSHDKRLTYRHEDGPENCTSNNIPVFTHDVTDLSLIARIIPPAGVQERGELKTHSYLHNINRVPLPVYTPADGVIIWGTHVAQQNEQGKFDISRGDEYALFIELDCNHYLFFDHVTDPVDAIRAALPTDPAINSTTQFLDPPITVRAGELLGETTGTQVGGIWDFGVYDRRKKNLFPSSVRNVSKRDEQGMCPYDFFTGQQQGKYRKLYDKTYSNYERVLELCL